MHSVVLFVALVMQGSSFLLYGANGYTGELIARYAAAYQLQPILAGRNKTAVLALSQKLNLPYRVFSLEDSAALRAALKEVNLVVHAAGPFDVTAVRMVEACLDTATHYLDINGDVSVFETIHQYGKAAQKAGIQLMPGVGFDVVPTDCAAAFLKQKLPDADTIQLAFASLGGGLSHGTASTMIQKLGEGGLVRKRGILMHEPLGKKGIWVDFGTKKLFVMRIPWGDLATAYYSTGIPNIETYTAVSPAIFRLLKFQGLVNGILRTKTVRKWLQNKINQRPAGPSDEQRTRSLGLIWGKATNAAGHSAVVTLKGPDGYTLTAHSTLLIAKRVLDGDFQPGYQTPASAYGADLILEVPGMSRSFQ